MTTSERVHFEHCEPILRVEDMDVALAFYEGSLGFKSAPWGSKDFTHVSRDLSLSNLAGQGWCVVLDRRERREETSRRVNAKGSEDRAAANEVFVGAGDAG
jgi:hypothetical protein